MPAHIRVEHSVVSLHKLRRLMSGGLRAGDRRLADEEEPPLASHLVSPRAGFAHHGIYVGEGRVVHYGSPSLYLRWGPVEEVSLACFTQGHPIWVRPKSNECFRCEEVVTRARSRIGENQYHLLTNNCEHFCEWCLYGKPRSHQVERIFRWPRRDCAAG